jgi:hypothetical protein
MADNIDPSSKKPVQEDPVTSPAPPSSGGAQDATSVRKAIITNPEALSDPEYSDVDAPPVDEIAADEGKYVVGAYTVSWRCADCACSTRSAR